MLIGWVINLKYFLVGILKIYQMIPLEMHRFCRYTPSCSQYAIDAIQKYGCMKGSFLAIKRIGRCRRKGGFGYDPVQ